MLGTHHQTLSPSHHVVPDGNGFQGLMTLGSGSQQGSRKATEFKGDSRPFRSFETRLLSCRERKSLRRVGRSEKCQQETSQAFSGECEVRHRSRFEAVLNVPS